ncbi:MAG TPA: T9SS type A sorting domain-containing protein [Paludibacteraceae bacterium]|nr:T9SS type A sorting domain-containing protein [Paludibacteraceae bacterium]
MRTKLLLSLGLLGTMSFLYGQQYRPGKQIDHDNTAFVRKVELKKAGEVMMKVDQISVTDTTSELSASLYSPDFTLFKNFHAPVPADGAQFFFGHGGVTVAENLVNNQPRYYFLYQTEGYSEDESGFRFFQDIHIIDENQQQVGKVPTSWMGYQLYMQDGKNMLISDYQDWDTISWSNPETGWSGWETFQVHTSAVTDVATGQTIFTFPRGTTFSNFNGMQSGIYYATNEQNLFFNIDGEERILTTNNNFEKYYLGHSSGNHENALDMWIYNKDFSLYKKISNVGYDIPIENLYMANTYQPLFGKHAAYFYHTVTYQTDGGLNYNSKTYLVNLNGELVKTIDGNFSIMSVVYLPQQDKDVALSMNWTNGAIEVLSIPDFEVIGEFNDLIKDKNGNVKFVKYTDDALIIMNEDFSTYKSIPLPDKNTWSFQMVDYYSTCADEKIEFVFTGKETETGTGKGLLVINEDNETIIDMPDFSALHSSYYADNLPIILRKSTDKYGRPVSDEFISYYRTGKLPTQIKLGGNPLPGADMQILKQTDNELIALDKITMNADGKGEIELGEGVYYLKALQTQNGLNTYYPNVLLWENATAIPYNTDPLEEGSMYCIEMQSIPVPVNPTAQGVIVGKIVISQPEAVQQLMRIKLVTDNGSVPIFDVYLQNTADNSIIDHTQTDENGNYRFENVPAGSYRVLVNVDGKPMESVNTVTLTTDADIVENVNYEITETGVVARMPSGLKYTSTTLIIYPNPAKDFIYLPQSAQNAKVQVLDVQGRILLNIDSYKGEKLDVSRLSNGWYMVQINNGNRIKTGKFIKIN